MRLAPSHRLLFAVFLLATLAALSPSLSLAQSTRQTQAVQPATKAERPCLPIQEAAKSPEKDICVTAHVFEVVELPDGTRFLDVCAPGLPDDQCPFTLLSLRQDRDDVGDLLRYRDHDVKVRGIVHATHGRFGITISHMRQFSGGPEKFRPNPRLLRDFNGQSDRMPVRDPNLAATGRHRSFMDNRDREPLPASAKR